MPPFIQFFKDMSVSRVIAVIAMILVLLLMLLAYLFRASESDLAILYADLDIQDSAAVTQELDKRAIPYTVLYDGTVIKVAKSKVVSTRLLLAQAGLPNSGNVVGYEIFDSEDSIGVTNFSQNIKFVRALEGELSRTISAFDQVLKARVHLVIPQREIFSKERMDTKASVVLKLRANKKLSKAEIDGISHLVVTSVSGLEMKNVTIVDTAGRSLKIGSNEEDINFISGKNEELRIAYEKKLQQEIESLLENVLGTGKVKASVALEMNFDREVVNSEIYDPDSAVVRSSQSTDEREQTPVSNIDSSDVSVANNVPGALNENDISNKFAIVEKNDQTTNYEISKTVRNFISEIGTVKKVSVGILVDGNYTKNAETQQIDYSDISETELNKIENLVKVLIGFDEGRGDKVEVLNMKFSAHDTFDLEDDINIWFKEEIPGMFQTLVFAVIAILTLITVIRPIALKAFEMKGNGIKNIVDTISSSTTTAATADAVRDVQNNKILAEENANAKAKNIRTITKINELVQKRPQELLSVMNRWIDNDE